MVLADDRILEYLEVEGPQSPVRVSRDDRLEYERQYVNRRLLKLAEAGLVDKDRIGRGVYAINDVGREYLEGELDARELPAPE
nr:putative phage repressor protein [Halorubrum sp. T3]